jgi:ACS family tartrate transporter-like MFS transporter
MMGVQLTQVKRLQSLLLHSAQPSTEGQSHTLPTSAPAAQDTNRGPIQTASAADDRVFAKIAWRLMPLLIAGYILNYLDRNNVGFAALTMNRALGLTATQFGRAGGIFFLGYCFFELPSNIALYRVGPRIWLARIMITWGLMSAATIFATGPLSLYLLRFLLGVAEAGFFPGVAFYLGTWFPSEYRTRMIAWFMVAVPLSSVVAGPVSGELLQMDGIAGLSGWKWLFLLQGLPVVAIGLVMLKVLADRPEQARWLTDRERQVVRDRLGSERREREVRHLGAALKDTRVLILAGVQFGFLVGSYGVGLFLPQIIKLGDLSNREVGLVSSACYIVATIGMVTWASQVDRRGGKVVNLALACLVSAVGFVGAIASSNFWVSLTGVTVALTGINAARGIFWTIPPRFLTGMAAAGGLAFINSIGTMGGFVGPYVMGWLTDRTGSFDAGLAAMSVFLLIATGLSWSLRWFVTQD